MWMIWTALVALVVLIVLGYLEKKYKRCGIYTQPGICYTLKRLLARAHFKFVRLQRAPRVHNYDYSSENYVRESFVPCPEDEESESLRPLTEPQSHDGVTFFGSDCQGHQLLVRLVRRTGRQAELLLLLQADGQLYQLPGMPDTTVYNTGSGWRAAGLAMECLLPMRLWRITYRGQLRRYVAPRGESADASASGATFTAAGELVPAQLSLLWQPLSAPCDLRDCDTDLMARAVARELWTPEFLSLMGSFSLDGYLQFGCLRGELSVAGSPAEEVFLRGPRQHRWSDGEGPQTAAKHRSLRLQARMADGSQLMLAADSWRGGITHLVYGVYMGANLAVSPIASCNVSLPDLAEEGEVPGVFNFIFSDGVEQHAVSCMSSGVAVPSFCDRPWRWINKLQVAAVCLDGVEGTAIIEFGYRYSGPCPLRPEISLPLLVGLEASAVESSRRVVPLSDPACRSEALVGGKAASLALLTELDLAEAVVPRGVVVTAHGYRHQLRHQPALREAAERVVRVSAGIEEGELSQVCHSAVQEFQKTIINEKILEDLEALLEEQFGKTWTDVRFAVRSSALGEDGEELSSAGQNATVLGCRGRDQLRSGLTECWASLLAPHSVQYRRQHGQHVHPGMAVVVQEMVPAEVSGVMFTRDPVTGDPSRISITASYGLGESVVSAKVDPDTITVGRSHTDELEVTERQLGTKKTQTVMAAGGGTKEVQTVSGAAVGCLPDPAALRLARIGVHLENAFGGPRDVEWAMAKGQIYLLQCRPVTSSVGWSELELTHEFDAAQLTDHECITNANTGEVLPDAISPLSLNTSCRAMEMVSDSLRKFLYGVENPCPAYTGQYFPISHYRYMIDVTRTFLSSLQSWDQDDTERASLMTVFGHLVDVDHARATAIKRYGVLSTPVKVYQQIAALRLAWSYGSVVKRTQRKYGRFTIDTTNHSRTAQELYRYICSQLPELKQSTDDHVFCTTAGNLLQIILLGFLSDDGQNAFDQEMFSSFAVLLSTCSGAESAEVPSSLKRLSRLIAATDDVAEFVSASADDGLVWLKTRHPLIANTFRDFLATHGHRGLIEMDLLSIPWEMEPRPLVTTLQTMVKNADRLEDNKTDMDVPQALQQLKVPLSSRSKKMVSFLLPYVRQSVVRRECTKSLLVRVQHQFRLAFRRLGELMVREGRLPEVELIFFMTLYDLKKLLDTRSPGIIIKASRRRRLLPKLNQLKFPELMNGIPRPLSSQKPAPDPSGLLVVKGTPVCQGRVEGTARVIHSVTEAGQIQRDDILITHATDIGWSPFFPVLGGVVTELGGLISHGAVVAREYGLACVVGATGATDAFQSGDKIILDGTLGTITRISSASQPASDDTEMSKHRAEATQPHAQTPKPKAEMHKPQAEPLKTRVETPKPEPQSEIPKPQAETPKPQVGMPKPQVETPKPQAETPKPQVVTPKPQVGTPKPQVETPKPQVGTPKPRVETPKPQVEIPKTQVGTPKPKVETSKPQVGTPKPQVETPKPQVETPKPQAETPKPQIEKPRPQVGMPKPQVETPKPQVETPKPQVGTPKPQVETPKHEAEAPKLQVETPKSQVETPKPQVGTPKPQVKTPKPHVGTSRSQDETPKHQLEPQKSQIQTPKPQSQTPKPQVGTSIPQVEAPEVQVETPKPETKTPKPQVEMPKPRVGTPQPQFETPKPQVETPKPQAGTPKPQIETPKPQFEPPKPQVETPKPHAETPKPQVEAPKPQAETSKPQIGAPKPQPQTETLKPQPKAFKHQIEAPESQAETLKPQSETSNYKAETPKFQNETPKPLAETPNTQSGTPKPQTETPRPPPETPKLRAETSKPLSETPKHHPETPKTETETSLPPKPQT